MMVSGEADAVSIEHGGEEVYNSSLDRWETKSLIYYGLAAVDMGACETCKVRHQSKADAIDISQDSLQNSSQGERTVVETVSVENKKKECEEMDEEFKKALSDFDARLKAIEINISDAKALSEKEMSEKATLVKQLASCEERIKKIESEPKQKALASSEVVEMRIKADLPKLE